MKITSSGTCRLVLVVSAMLLVGCSSKPKVMPTPNIYVNGDAEPFVDVAPELQNNKVDVLYLTDRAPDNKPGEPVHYGYHRSRSVAFGVAQVELGHDVSWEQLVQASRSSKREVDLPMSITNVTEIVRFPPTPRTIVELPAPVAVSVTGAPTPTTAPTAKAIALQEEIEHDYDIATNELTRRLAMTPTKEVYIFVHGYANNFDYSVTTIAQLWHFFGRQGVPIAYSWPAGRGGLLRGYTYDRESSEFTVYHMKQMLRIIAACPEVKKVNIIGHSRGTDVVVSALRELHLEITASGKSTREVLKLGTLVLAAPDLDMDVVIQRLVTARVGRVPEQFVLYVNANDGALGISNWLFGGSTRLGRLRSDVFTPEELQAIRMFRTIQIVDVQVSKTGSFGHDYFHSNPAVSSDLILAMRYGLLPGADTGRPLYIDDAGGFWQLHDGYPGNEKTLKGSPATAPAAGQ